MASPSAAIRTPELPAGNAKLDAEQLKAAIAASLDDSRWHDAAALCRRYLKLFPDDSEVLQAAAHCFERTGDMETARLTWKHIRSLGKS
jgi:Flp pilus assembly protein TadD